MKFFLKILDLNRKNGMENKKKEMKYIKKDMAMEKDIQNKE